MKRKINESGRTMVEMMGVLAIIGVIMYGAIVGIGFGVDMYKVTATYNDLEKAAEDLKDLYSWSRGGYGNLNLGFILCQEDLDPLIPKDKCPDAKDAKDYKFSSRWTGVTIQIHGNKYVDNDLDGQHFIISVNSLSKFACRRLADMKWNQVDVCEEDVNDDVCGTWKTDCDDDNSLILISN